MQFDWTYVIAVIYGLITLGHFIYFALLARNSVSMNPLVTVFMMFVLAVLWPITWAWYLTEKMAGRA